LTKGYHDTLRPSAADLADRVLELEQSLGSRHGDVVRGMELLEPGHEGSQSIDRRGERREVGLGNVQPDRSLDP